jgi:hypothetical protein
MSVGLLKEACIAKAVHVVEMDDVQFLAFHQSKVSSIGTKDLAGCSVVMIASPYGEIVAHIPPNPNRDAERPSCRRSPCTTGDGSSRGAL